MRLAAVANKFERTNLSVPSVIVGIIKKPAPRSVASGFAMGTLGFAGAYKSETNAALVFELYFKVYQNGITSFMRSELFTTAGSEVLIDQ